MDIHMRLDNSSSAWWEAFFSNWDRGFIDKLGIIATVAIIIGLPLLAIWCLVRLCRGIARHRSSEPCIHCGRKTADTGNDDYNSCYDDRPCCANCRLDHLRDTETVYTCPVCQQTMVKKTDYRLRIITDVCSNPTCSSILLQPDELQALTHKS